MTTAPLLDTHAWIWWLTGDPRLDKMTIDALDALPTNDRPFLSDVSLFEIAILVGLKRLVLPIPFEEWLDAAAHPRTVRSVPIVPDVAKSVAKLAGTFRDPADRVIVATSQTINAPLLTRDKLIIRSRLVKRWTPKA